ncbi:hypothetical protein BS47DRAFT_179789 [Hydnum rufescens UP504]|uniref:Uncharacterized protein n=1 Tax=Hydnum rufescens UP504 TaxID=1448309 RepID=A0A9P6ANG5_9AGAM|nr:hypothetical protein BS47DRAFT_179789 [Hydnum rufescens UP504]
MDVPGNRCVARTPAYSQGNRRIFIGPVGNLLVDSYRAHSKGRRTPSAWIAAFREEDRKRELYKKYVTFPERTFLHDPSKTTPEDICKGMKGLTGNKNWVKGNLGKGISLSFVDVRDNALAHAVALESPDAGGERFLANTGTFTWQDQSASSSLPGTDRERGLFRGYPQRGRFHRSHRGKSWEWEDACF